MADGNDDSVCEVPRCFARRAPISKRNPAIPFEGAPPGESTHANGYVEEIYASAIRHRMLLATHLFRLQNFVLEQLMRSLRVRR
jgi:hypothetical protein